MGGKLKREDVCILIGDSHRCTAETNTTLYSNYTPIENKLKNKGLKKKKETQNLRLHSQSVELALVLEQAPGRFQQTFLFRSTALG